MKIKMLKTVPGSIDGIKVKEFNKGEVYDLPLFLSQSFISKKFAAEYMPELESILNTLDYEKKVVEPEEVKKADNLEDDLKEKTVKDLKEMAKNLGLKGYSRLKEDELIQMILEARK